MASLIVRKLIFGACLLMAPGTDAVVTKNMYPATHVLAQVKEIDFDPYALDNSTDIVADSDLVDDDGNQLTLEDINDKYDTGANNMYSCVIELQKHIFNFQSLSL